MGSEDEKKQNPKQKNKKNQKDGNKS